MLDVWEAQLGVLGPLDLLSRVEKYSQAQKYL